MSYLAHRYAQALYEAGCEQNAFFEAADFVLEHTPLWDALKSPIISRNEKEAVLEALPTISSAPFLLNFFTLLIESRRIGLLPEIVQEYRLLILQEKQVAECIVTCVSIPSESQQERLKKALCKLHNKPEVRLVFCIDPEIIGGFILNLDGITYDQSIRGRIRGLSRYLEEVNAI